MKDHIKSKVNPSGYPEASMQVKIIFLIQSIKKGGNYINDDANLKIFMDHLIKFAVDSPNWKKKKKKGLILFN